MKNIAVLLHSLTVEYALSVLKGIADFYSDKDVRLFISQTYLKYIENTLFDYQFWATTSLLNSKDIDGVIVISSSYTSSVTLDDLKNVLSRCKSDHVISIGINPELKNVYYTICNTRKVYDDIIRHLKEKHGCKKIAFMSANPTKSNEAIERFESFKEALKNNGLKFYPEMVYDARFTKSTTHATLEKYLKTKEDVKFDAIVSANDLMAVGVLEHLEKIGVSVPEEVKIIGFDNTSCSSMTNPTLSTIDQQIFQQGYEAGKLLYDILNGKKVSFEKQINLAPLYRQSCGCVSLEDKNLSYINEAGEINTPSNDTQTFINQYFQALEEMNSIPTLIDLLKARRTLRGMSTQLPYILGCSKLSSMAVCYYDNPVAVKNGESFVTPENAYLSIYVDNDQDFVDFYEKTIPFNPRNNILPNELQEKIKGEFILYPIFEEEIQYGYLITKFKDAQYNALNVYLRIIINSLVQAYLYTEDMQQKNSLTKENKSLQERNTNLNYESKIDELTQILNRRSFIRYGQQLIDFSTEIGTKGIVIFGDLDGLKTINDTYGHDIGDLSIRTEARVLKESFRKSDIVGRLSGDEFAIIAPGLSIETLNFYCRKKIISLNQQYSKENNLKFDLSISLGAAEFNSENKDLQALLAAADENLYIEKKEKHAKRDAAKAKNKK